MRLTKIARFAPLAVLAAGALAVPAVSQAAGSATAVCKSSGHDACTATFSLAGGASRKKLTVKLPDTDLKLVGVSATPSYVAGAYQVYNPSYSLGGSEFHATLDAVKSIGKGAKLTIRFGLPETMLNCGGIHTGVSSLVIVNTGDASSAAYSCPQAAAVGETWLKRFNAYKDPERFSVKGIAYTCKVVPHPANILCTGARTEVSFGGPTGH